MDNRKKEFLENRRKKVSKPERKTEYERKRTREEVEQIKKDLINYASTSWGKEWIYHNLQIGRPFRMQRGIDYANDEKRIDNISINKGQIFATVQGTAPTPYRVKINFETIDKENWKNIVQKLSKEPISLIELLEGNLPTELIKFFEEIGQNLFPNALKGLEASCSCPDKAIPCKHIASVILYLSRVIDFNPFLLLELKGISKDDLLHELSFKGVNENIKLVVNSKEEEMALFNFKVPKMSNVNNIEFLKKNPIMNFSIRKPTKIIEMIDNLGMPYNLENKAFDIVIQALYRYVSAKTFEISEI
jgi:uncharacterized Zn finger protein